MNRNFALPRVKSINTSGHKFGLVYAGGQGYKTTLHGLTLVVSQMLTGF